MKRSKTVWLIIFGLLVMFVSGCGMFVSKSNAAQAAEKQGYSNVTIDSKHIFFVDWRGCSKDDDVAFKAHATNALGQKVDLIICAGWPFKGVTVRTK